MFKTKYPPLARTQACSPLINCVINHRLLQATPHAVDAVAGSQLIDFWSHTHVAEWQTTAPDMWPPNSTDLNTVDYAIWSVIQLDAAGNILTVHYKDMKCDVSFSLSSVSTLFRWGGHFCHICVKRFLLFTTVQKLQATQNHKPRLRGLTILSVYDNCFCKITIGISSCYLVNVVLLFSSFYLFSCSLFIWV